MTSTILKAGEIRELIEEGRVTILRDIEPQPTLERPLLVTPRGKRRDTYQDVTYVYPFMEGNKQRWVKEQFVLFEGNYWYTAGIPKMSGEKITGWIDYPYRLDGEIDAPPDSVKPKNASYLPRHASRVVVRDVSCEVINVLNCDSQTAIQRWLDLGHDIDQVVWQVELVLEEQ